MAAHKLCNTIPGGSGLVLMYVMSLSKIAVLVLWRGGLELILAKFGLHNLWMTPKRGGGTRKYPKKRLIFNCFPIF